MKDVAVSADSRAPPKFKQRTTPTFKSKALKPEQKGSRDDIPGLADLGTDVAVVCPCEALGDMEPANVPAPPRTNDTWLLLMKGSNHVPERLQQPRPGAMWR
ncbi:Retinal cone rhodopsin-sensitive cGMP 3',5'-cyclic phosphodiesterase subunit gamma [Liparis tanakae]|uniref:3',5'-cyclic-GMP phosphodiesterase n=1 Tax=Liparis tanakae TaxID=230148 RepID=A0A4Z2J016_9TELE|nr:Retinal cone rhodopsin-sensitive cGMP 3',5'-cyclic phosphodiesterase subunit gamma [Liparis tanakae]